MPLGMHRLEQLRDEVVGDSNVSPELKRSFTALFGRLDALDVAVSGLTDKIVAHVEGNDAATRLSTIQEEAQ